MTCSFCKRIHGCFNGLAPAWYKCAFVVMPSCCHTSLMNRISVGFVLALHVIRMWCCHYKELEMKSICNRCFVELIVIHSLFSFRVALCVNAVVFYIFTVGLGC
jgi:hypothetical protein